MDAYRIENRYTAGSPATLYGETGFQTATQVAREEAQGYEIALTGVYGEELQRVAKIRGAAGIVVYHKVGRKGFYRDMITGRVSNEPL